MGVRWRRELQRGRGRLAAAVAVAAVAASLVASVPSPARAATSTTPAVGVQMHALWSGSDWTDSIRIRMLDKLAAAGVGWIRVDVGWCSIEYLGKGDRQQWYLSRMDMVFAAAAARGIKVFATLWCTPSWAGDGSAAAVPTAADFADIAGYVAARFRGKVAAWEVWNEPNLGDFFQGGPSQYAGLVRSAYPRFKAGDPDTLVAIGGTVHNDDAWLGQMFDAGVGAGHYDVLAPHPYQGPSDESPTAAPDGGIWKFRHVEAVRNLMVARGHGAKPIWLGEVGYSTHGRYTSENWRQGVTEAEQATYTRAILDLVRSEYPYVTHVFFYSGRDVDEPDPHLANFGLLRTDLSEKPAFGAIRDWIATHSAPTYELYPDAAPPPSTVPSRTVPATGSATAPGAAAPAPAPAPGHGVPEAGRAPVRTQRASRTTRHLAGAVVSALESRGA